MCYTTNKAREVAQVAKKDIKVYKVFNEKNVRFDTKSFKLTIRSVHMGFTYEFGECYHEDGLVAYTCGSINVGLHSYSTLNKAKNSWGGNLVVECTIPEGAKYFFNPNSKEYVSDYIVIGTPEKFIHASKIK
jgi:hypothetical protein